MSEITETRIYCNHCKSRTRHILSGEHRYRFSDGDGPDEWGEYRLWRCAGCDTGTMEDHYTADYFALPSSVTKEAEFHYESIYHPKRAHEIRPSKSFVKLPRKLVALYAE